MQGCRRESTGSRWREVILPLGCIRLWAPQCKTDMAILERTPTPVLPPAPPPVSFGVGTLVRWSQQPPVPAGGSCAGTEWRWEEAGPS